MFEGVSESDGFIRMDHGYPETRRPPGSGDRVIVDNRGTVLYPLRSAPRIETADRASLGTDTNQGTFSR